MACRPLLLLVIGFPFVVGCSDSDVKETGFEPDDGPFALSALRGHVDYLASDALGGRESGSAGDALAIDYIEEAFMEVGLSEPAGGYRQPFVDGRRQDTENVAGVLWAEGDVSNEIIVVMAHHDHLGTDDDGTIYPGANDNASGVGMLLSLADAFTRGNVELRRTIVFASFGGEELWMDGSKAWVEGPPSDLPIADTVFGVNLDMVGTYRTENLIYALDAAGGTPARAVLEAVMDDHPSIRVNMEYPGSGSDSTRFCQAGVPGVFMYTDDDCYHRPCDTPDNIDWPEYAETASLVMDMLIELANGEYGLAEARSEGCR